MVTSLVFGRAGVVLGALGLGALAACAVTAADAAPANEIAPDGDAPQPFSQVVRIDQLAVYQGVKVTLVDGGEVVPPNAPVIPGRPALVRLGLDVPPRTKLAKLTADLRVRTPGRPDVVVTNGPRTVRRFDDADLASSFVWELDPDQVGEGASLSVEVRDPSGADPTVLRHPAEGDVPMNVGSVAPTLRVKFVPIEYGADDSNRVPSMDERVVEAYQQALYRLYPVSEVEITVRDVLAWPLEVRGDGTGWAELLDAVIETREDDQPAEDVYYVGVFNPADTVREYCRTGGCVLGVAPAMQQLAAGLSFRTALIVGFHSERQQATLAQELAHSMGRMHAPCGGPSDVDKGYPYAEARIGTWGWDVAKKELVAPDARYDFMSYCNPIWVSDYTYASLYDRMREVDLAARAPGGAPRAMRSYHVGKDGSMRAGPTIRGVPSFADEIVLEGGARVRGSLHPISNLGEGLFVTPDEVPEATRRASVRPDRLVW